MALSGELAYSVISNKPFSYVEPPVLTESIMLRETYSYIATRTIQPYAYGTEKHTIRVRYVPYAYGMKYACGTQQYR